VKVGILCEASAVVRKAFEARGHDAWSCDILPRPGNHIRGDALAQDWRGFDLLICHPPCTYLAVCGAKHFKRPRRKALQEAAIQFVRDLLNLPVEMIALENPVGVLSTQLRKPDQIIQPWQFGDEAQKTTCLWLKNLPKLVPTRVVGRGEFVTTAGGNRLPKWYSDAKVSSRHKTQSVRSKTFQGIADAMADQWGSLPAPLSPKETRK